MFSARVAKEAAVAIFASTTRHCPPENGHGDHRLYAGVRHYHRRLYIDEAPADTISQVATALFLVLVLVLLLLLDADDEDEEEDEEEWRQGAVDGACR